MPLDLKDTIAAVATPPASSAIGVVRLSGTLAVEIAGRVFFPGKYDPEKSFVGLENLKDRELCHGWLCDTDVATGEKRPVDEVMCAIMRGTRTYTGEDCVELYTHGSPVVLDVILSILIKNGARVAGPGEFTKRAFLNGRIDLSRAEAVADLISADARETAANAAGQLSGALGKELDAAEGLITGAATALAAYIEYTDQGMDISDSDMEALVCKVPDELEAAADRLRSMVRRGERALPVTEGVRCVIVGKPNTGKSSLINRILGYDRAIVTDVPGTTRDTVEAGATIGGVRLKLFDTAGIRQTDDRVESEGIARSRAAAEGAGLVLAAFDASASLDRDDYEIISLCDSIKGGKKIALLNKTDLPKKINTKDFAPSFSHIAEVSALTGEGMDELKNAVKRCFDLEGLVFDGGIVTSARHRDAMGRAAEAALSAASSIREGVTCDAVLGEIEEALEALGEISGKRVTDEVVDAVFARFCVGK